MVVENERGDRCAVGSVNHGGSSMIGRSLVVGRWSLGIGKGLA